MKLRRTIREEFGGEGGRRGAFVVLPVQLAERVATMRPHGLPSHLALYWKQNASSSIRSSYLCRIHRTICHHVNRSTINPVSPKIHQRGAKTKTTVKLKDLPQGVLKLDAYDDRVDEVPRYPTVVQGHRNNMQTFKNCVVLTRVGGFYEVREQCIHMSYRDQC